MFGILGNLHCAAIKVTTAGSADTALGTLPNNPFEHSRVIPICVSGEGVYIEDDDSESDPFLSGITTDGVDIRSSVASAEAFVLLADVSARELFAVTD